MAAAARMTRQPPRRGEPYYDVDRGRQMIVPPGGGKAVEYVGPSGERGFEAGKALRRAGVRTVQAADRAAGAAPARTRRALRRADALPDVGGSPLGLGGLLIYGFATIVGLALLENALSGRGPAAVGTVLGAFGGGLKRLVDPGDPLISRGTPAASSGTVVTSSGARIDSPGSSAVGPMRTGGGADRPGQVSLAKGADRAGHPTRLVVINFVKGIAARVGRTLTIGTGTNHSRLTVNGNESAHWTGYAADIPATGAWLIRLGRAALIEAGMSPAQANRQNGGLFNVGRWQIIFNTHIGGDHTNHLHVGLASWAQGR